MVEGALSEVPGGVFKRTRTKILAGLAVLLILLGLVGASNAAVGYGLFLLATLLILAGGGLLAAFTLTRWFEGFTARPSMQATMPSDPT